MGPLNESKVLFDKSIRPPGLLHVKDVELLHLFVKIFELSIEDTLVPAEECIPSSNSELHIASPPGVPAALAAEC